MSDVTDATFQTAVIERSNQVPVVVDLWAPWCGPCLTLGPIIEAAVNATEGQVELAKVNVDENPAVSASFKVQSIPAVFAIHEGKVVSSFVGALPEDKVQKFVNDLVVAPSAIDLLVEAGDEASLRAALEEQSDHLGAIEALGALLIDAGQPAEALELFNRVPPTANIRALSARARLTEQGVDLGADSIASTLDGLLDSVRDDEDARRRYLDLLETIGVDDPRSLVYRKALSARLF